MSSSATNSKTGATFLWVLGAFGIFALLFLIVQAVAGKGGHEDPRADSRRANREEVVAAQTELVKKMGLRDPAKKDIIFAKTIETLRAEKPSVSTQVVPGSPTQLKQAAAAAAAAPAPAAPAAPAGTPPSAPAPAPAAQPK